MNFGKIVQMNNAQNGSGAIPLARIDDLIGIGQTQPSRRLRGTTSKDGEKTIIVFDPLPDEPLTTVDASLLTQEQQTYVKARYEAYIAEYGYIIDDNPWIFLVPPHYTAYLRHMAVRRRQLHRQYRWNKIHKRQRRAAQRCHYRGKA